MVKFKIFQELSTDAAFRFFRNKISEEVKQKKDDYILNVNEEEWEAYFINKYKLFPLILYTENVGVSFHKKNIKEGDRKYCQDDVIYYTFKIDVPFTGSSELFRLYPNPHTLNVINVSVTQGLQGNVTGYFTINGQDKAQVEKQKRDFLNGIQINMAGVNEDVKWFNVTIPEHFQQILKSERSRIEKEKKKQQEELDFFKSIDVEISIDTNTERIFEAPVIKKKKIPEPKYKQKKKLKYDEIPTFSDELYKDVLKIIYDIFKSVEKKPSIYKNKGEEALRDYLLPIIETRYIGTTATGETFNKKGKTDILIKYEDGTNLFVAECKFWKGKVSFHKTIDQLFYRYLTWRDSKVAIILFVENKDFSAVLDVIKEEAKNHPYYFKENGIRGESSFSYMFKFPDDSKKKVFTEIMAFSFNQR